MPRCHSRFDRRYHRGAPWCRTRLGPWSAYDGPRVSGSWLQAELAPTPHGSTRSRARLPGCARLQQCHRAMAVYRRQATRPSVVQETEPNAGKTAGHGGRPRELTTHLLEQVECSSGLGLEQIERLHSQRRQCGGLPARAEGFSPIYQPAFAARPGVDGKRGHRGTTLPNRRPAYNDRLRSYRPPSRRSAILIFNGDGTLPIV